MSILRIRCSPRGLESESYRLSELILDRLAQTGPAEGLDIVEFDATTLTHADSDYAAVLAAREEPAADGSENGSLLASGDLIRMLDEASHIVLATPMHNFTVPSALKAWLDHVVRVRHTFHITPQGKVGLLADRPVYVAISSGGTFSGEEARQPDFLTPYLRHVLATIGLKQVTFVTVEGTARGQDLLEAARARAQAAVNRIAFEIADDAVPA
ncbi:FMN-dependent NADH-azoreductase [Achromobacter spanius]|uniref:FMN dependent NADH:quinone oxidoreductase n=1 Tax=Achromobacter spanius TaxID=217203 RepID=A0A2S0I7W4_9BURK|nr:NAD(P)H-dependent oxidoreductase [Achromobacter spanius]AVJ28098.1 NAD(P)H dehydrogenase [Achromobacter spanius]